jgi:hypothetical protein
MRPETIRMQALRDIDWMDPDYDTRILLALGRAPPWVLL